MLVPSDCVPPDRVVVGVTSLVAMAGVPVNSLVESMGVVMIGGESWVFWDVGKSVNNTWVPNEGSKVAVNVRVLLVRKGVGDL